MEMERGLEGLKRLGACGMFGESFRVISTKKKLFAQITLALILPLSLLFLVQSMITQLVLDNSLKSSDHRGNYFNQTEYASVFDTSNGWAISLSTKVMYFTLVLILTLLATSAVTYTVACIYASKDVTFKKVMAVVPRVWKRLIVTFFWIFLIYIVLSLIFSVLLVCAVLLSTVNQPVGIVLAIVVIIAFIVGIFYIAIIMQLSCVVSVLEDLYGRKAISRSRVLVKGKLWSIVGCFVLLSLWFGLVELGFEFLVAVGVVVQSVALRVVFGIVLWLVLALQSLVGLVTTTVTYFVCRSYHREDMDMSVLGDQLKVHYEAKYVELEQSRV